MWLGTLDERDWSVDMKNPQPKPTTIRCCICAHLYEPDTIGSGIEVGTTRRFCKPCFEDLLRVNGIRPEDFLEDHDTLPIWLEQDDD
jgi:hypothetical protein